MKWLSDNFVCKKCRTVPKNHQFQFKNVGLATTISHLCDCHKQPNCPLLPATRSNIEKSTNHKANIDYSINVSLVLACQTVGIGQREASKFLAVLGLTNDRKVLGNTWSKIEEFVCKTERKLCEELVEQKLRREIELTPQDDAFPLPQVDSCKDMGWNKKGCGKSYNADSGQHLSVDPRTNKVIHFEFVNRGCFKCSRKMKHPPGEECPRNYPESGSSKGMESYAAGKALKKLFYEKKVIVRTVVIDNDSTTKAILSHRTNEKGSRGELPPEHPPLTFRSDKNHQVRCFGKHVWALARQPKKTCILTKVDAKRLKRNFPYFIFSGPSREFDEWQKSSRAVYKHVFDDHSLCGTWCSARKLTVDERKKQGMFFYDLREHADLFAQVESAVDLYFQEELLREVHHSFSTNKCESLNAKIARHLPKNKYLQGTFGAEGRVCLAICLDSVGHEGTFSVLGSLLGLPWMTCSRESLSLIDKKHGYESKYKKRQEVRQKRAKKAREKIQEEIKKEHIDKKRGRAYRSGIAVTVAKGEKKDGENHVEDNDKKTKKTEKICTLCHKKGHLTSRSKSCAYHQQWLEKRKGKCSVCVSSKNQYLLKPWSY